MKRPDIFELVEHATSVGLTTAMTPSATPLVTREAVQKLKDAGISRLALSLDAVDASTHDAFRGVKGSYARTLEILHWARECGLPAQINTTITKNNAHQIDLMAKFLAHQNIELWSVFFLIPVGRGQKDERISPEQYEDVFESLWNHARSQPFGIKTTEAHHYRRFVLQRAGNPQSHPGGAPAGRIQRAPIGVNDGKGVMFVSHTGKVYPSGFLPVPCGEFPLQSIVEIYQNSPVFQQLRDPQLLKGKCGACEYKAICGGSRARAYALTRDILAAELDCVYQPKAWKEVLNAS
mgnify:CR=1 FL=1